MRNFFGLAWLFLLQLLYFLLFISFFFLFHMRWAASFAFFFILMLFRTSTFASFLFFSWHESFSFLFLYFLQTSSAFLLLLMFLLHQAQEAQPRWELGHLDFHAKHGLKTCMEKPLTLFSTPSLSLFLKLSPFHAPFPTFHTFTPEQAIQSLFRRTFPASASLKLLSPEWIFHFQWIFYLRHQVFSLRHQFFLQVSIFSMRLMLLFFLAFASFCFYLFSSPSLLRLFFANLRLFMLFSHFLCFFANPLATFFYFIKKAYRWLFSRLPTYQSKKGSPLAF